MQRCWTWLLPRAELWSKFRLCRYLLRLSHVTLNSECSLNDSSTKCVTRYMSQIPKMRQASDMWLSPHYPWWNRTTTGMAKNSISTLHYKLTSTFISSFRKLNDLCYMQTPRRACPRLSTQAAWVPPSSSISNAETEPSHAWIFMKWWATQPLDCSQRLRLSSAVSNPSLKRLAHDKPSLAFPRPNVLLSGCFAMAQKWPIDSCVVCLH